MVAQGRPGTVLPSLIPICWRPTLPLHPHPHPRDSSVYLSSLMVAAQGPLSLDRGSSATTPCSLGLKSGQPFLEELQQGIGWKI